MTTSSNIPDGQEMAMVVTERVNSCLSILGILFITITYLRAEGFNKPINRLIFFAGFGNVGSNIASLISENGPLAGSDKPLCQFQGFLVQMFLGVDCYWAFCMAINVYLAFFRGYTTERLRALDMYYLVACYGLAFVPAIAFLFVSTEKQGKVYGEAIIWCWITTDWDWMRIAFLYAIVWVAMIFAFVVYVRAGLVIWSKRQHLDGFLNPMNEKPFTSTITTEIEITTDDRPMVRNDGMPTNLDNFDNVQDDESALQPYSVQIAVDPKAPKPPPAALRMRTLTRNAAEAETNAEAWLYARVAFLFFVALLITWVPTSVNRVYALAKPDTYNFALNYVASFVFPLQGFWNTIVYILTSQTACRRLWNRVFSPAAWRGDSRVSLSSDPKAMQNGSGRFAPNNRQRFRSLSSLSQ